MDDYECRCKAAGCVGTPRFWVEDGYDWGFQRNVNEYDCITLALITALHGVYDLQLKSRCDMASIYEEYDGLYNLEVLLSIKFIAAKF